MEKVLSRRHFLKATTASAATAVALGRAVTGDATERAAERMQTPWFEISLAQWSLHRALRGGRLTTLQFIEQTRRIYGIAGVEYVNVFFQDRARDREYLQQMKGRCDAEGVTSVLIMCDAEGRLGDPDDAARAQAVANHHQWVDAAAFLGCHSIRVNAASEGTWDEQSRLAADGLHRLAEYGDVHGINVLVENHGGLSSNGRWLSETIVRGNHSRLGTLPDFGNFRIAEGDWYDIYQGVEELMVHARAVSAKSHDFDDTSGDETTKDYVRLLGIVRAAGYRGWVGIEYEGERLDEAAGIHATRRLLERVRAQLAAGA